MNTTPNPLNREEQYEADTYQRRAFDERRPEVAVHRQLVREPDVREQHLVYDEPYRVEQDEAKYRVGDEPGNAFASPYELSEHRLEDDDANGDQVPGERDAHRDVVALDLLVDVERGRPLVEQRVQDQRD